jgi:hypothetical protein
MKPFRDNFSSNFQSSFIEPMEKELGVKFTDFHELLQGQLTVALTPPPEGSKEMFNFIVLLDAKEKGELLSTKLSELKKKWTDSGKEIRNEKIRDVEFSAISFTSKDLKTLMKSAFPGASAENEEEDGGQESGDSDDEKQPIWIGQHKSLLIVGEDSKAIEKLVARQTGGLVAPLSEKAEYQTSHNQLFRDSLAHSWINVKPIYEKVLQVVNEQSESGDMQGLVPNKILPALGFGSIESFSAKLGGTTDGSTVQFMLRVPEGKREGLLKLITLEKKDAAPPAFISADVTKFQRTRIDGQKVWATLEETLNKIDPSMAGLLQLMLSSAGKDKDPDFDLKKNLIGNLGDDFITIEKAPKSSNPEDLQATPSLTLIGSPNPTALLDALRMITSLLPPPLSTAPLKEREFLGKKIYTLSLAGGPSLPPDDGEDGEIPTPQDGTQSFSFASSAGYLAFATDDSMLEDYLRSGENPPKPLRERTGFAEAAQKAGGMENGFFSYENQTETVRLALEAVKNNPDFASMPVIGIPVPTDEESTLGRLLNPKLLPAFDRIAKYFGFAVASAGTSPEGFSVKVVAPKPAGLK